MVLLFDQDINWHQLRIIYEFESLRVSGPGSYNKDINDVLWTLDEFASTMHILDDEREKYIVLLNKLSDKNEILKINSDDGRDRYITRVAEITRLLGHNYEYYDQGRQGIDSIRWLIEEKKIPERIIPAEAFLSRLLSVVDSEISSENSYNLKNAVERVIIGVSRSFEPDNWKAARYSEFQFESTKEMILSQYMKRHTYQSQILTAGVGSGKTIGFTIAILVSAVESILGGISKDRCHLLLYPRTALARDQYQKIKQIIPYLETLRLQIHFEHYSFYDESGLTVKKGIETVYGKIGPPPNIIITTLETLNRRLQNPTIITKLSKYLKRVVLDEIHLIEGISGSLVIRLIDRLNTACEKDILWTGSSATVASPSIHASTVFGVQKKKIAVLTPSDEDLSTVGLIHHIFMRPTGITSVLGTLVNTSSIVIHNRREKIDSRQEATYPKTIGFADNLDILGRWNADFRENERTENIARGMAKRLHPDSRDYKKWTRKQKEIPYALRFQKPFQRRLEAEGGIGDPLEPVLSEYSKDKLCDRCKKGERIHLRTCSKDEMKALGRLIIREPFLKTEREKKQTISNEIFNNDEVDVGTLDLCPYLRAGACFWFSNDDFGVEDILVGSNPRYEWSSVARSRIYSSRTQRPVGLEEDLSEIVFKAPLNEVYDLSRDPQIPYYDKRLEKAIPIDMVIASPSLEVGIDLPFVTESVMYKAIRNVASYRQKAGRVGRESNTDSMNITLLSLRPVDLHYYRQPRKLTSKAQLDPIPLKEHNDSILRCGLYLATWDYLALFSNLPEVVPVILHDEITEFTTRLQNTKKYLLHNKENLKDYLSSVSRRRYSRDNIIFEEIIEQIQSEIDLLLTPMENTIDDERIKYVSDFIIHKIHRRGIKKYNLLSRRYKQLIIDGETFYNQFRPRIHPIHFDLSEEFFTLDLLSESGWVDLEKIKTINEIISEKIEIYEGEADINALKRISNLALSEIVAGLEGMQETGESPVVHYFIEQYDRLQGYQRYYLSYTMQNLPIFDLYRKNPSYTRPPNLFTNPYEPNVIISGISRQEEQVAINEALFGFIPGTWSYRTGKDAIKTLVGQLEVNQDVLLASLNNITRAGNEFIKIQAEVPAPPGSHAESYEIYRPVKLKVRRNTSKYVYVNIVDGTVIDDDESSTKKSEERGFSDYEEEDEGRRHTVSSRIPQSYLDRWVHIESGEGEEILVNDLDEENILIEGNIELRGREARKKIKHPLMNKLIDEIMWHEKLDVYDYVYSVTRSYTSRSISSKTIFFRDNFNNIAFGRNYTSEGVSITLNIPTFQDTVSQIVKGMKTLEGKYIPSLITAYQSAVNKIILDDGSPVNPFLVNDLFGVLISSLPDITVEEISNIQDHFSELLQDVEKFQLYARQYYSARIKITSDESEDEPEDQIERKNIEAVERQVRKISDLAINIPDNIWKSEEILEEWVSSTLLNTFGITALSALQRLCGSTDQNIGYTIDLSGLKKKEYRIFLFDSVHNGNGSNEILKRYMHILNIQRHGTTMESRLLPSDDFLTLLEEELLQCPQYHVDIDALEKISQINNGQDPYGIRELGYIGEYSDEILRVCKDTWDKLGIRGRADAWKLPLYQMAPDIIAKKKGVQLDDLIRAVSICWNGCPECVVDSAFTSGTMGTAYLDKLVLDDWFAIGRKKIESYQKISATDFAQGKSIIPIGKQSQVCLQLPDRKIRSISLPFTIGFEVSRHQTQRNADLIIRDNDILGLKIFDDDVPSSHGIESLGFKRIMWFNLIASAYLDVIDHIEENRKQIDLVFYDCRDIEFVDYGMSSRMMMAIEYYRKRKGMKGEITKLSDILIWLAESGFKVSLCVDDYRAKEEGVHKFLTRLKQSGVENISIRTKRLEGSMHKKALITPLGIIQGSANLTFSGTGRNEEVISYAPFGTRAFEEVRINILDTFHGSKNW